jgi:phosphonoacetate hydrolase
MEQSNQPKAVQFNVNQRSYSLEARPYVVVCVDGCADEYLDVTLAKGRMPNLQKMAAHGHRSKVRGALPSFTNVNNSSIVTGLPPSKHGIGGNFFYDTDKDEEVMMNSSSYLRCGTILAAAANAGRKVGVVTAKEKLRDILSHKLQGIAFSSEKAREAKMETHGIDNVETVVGEKTPEIYSPDASLYTLKSGVKLLEGGYADFLYLSLTDYMQHKYAPEEPESLSFYEAIDTELGKLAALGAIVGITADHGMNSKLDDNGQPNVIYLETLLNSKLGGGVRVILPITDPYVRHHGALGSFAVAYLPDPSKTPEVIQGLMEIDGITEVYDRKTAARKLELPEDRLGDLVAMSARNVVIGRSPEYHDLAALEGVLRSHGGRYEEMVPMVISHPLNAEALEESARDPRNFDIFHFTTNGTRLHEGA